MEKRGSRKDGTWIPQEPCERCDGLDKEIHSLREEVQQLRRELADATGRGTTAPQPNAQDGQVQRHFQRGSEVFASAFAAIAWTNDKYDATQLYVNQNNVLTELISVETIVPYPQTKPQWDRRFVFPCALMPNSTIAAATSFGSRHLIPDSDPLTDRGRDVIRVFYFDATETLREWVYDHTFRWRQSSLQVRGADSRNVTAICWAEDSFAEWSLFYTIREETINGVWQGRRLYERRYSGGSVRAWSEPLEIKLDQGDGNAEGRGASATLQSCFSALTNADGTERQIFYLNRSDSQIYTLRWGGFGQNEWLKVDVPKEKLPHISDKAFTSSFAAMCVAEKHWGHWKRIFIHDGNGVVEWAGASNNEWVAWKRFSSISTEGEVIATTSQTKGEKDKIRMYIFSRHQGKLIQTTFMNSQDPWWTSKPIVIRHL